MKKYYPILVSKKGEIVALQHLEQKVKDEVSPIIEVIENSIIKPKKEGGGFIYKEDLERFFVTHWSFFNNQIIMDFSLFKKWDIHKDKIRTMLIFLIKSGVNIVLSVQKGSSSIYKEIVKDLVKNYNCKICLRASVTIDGFYDYNNEIKKISNEYNLTYRDIVLLLDLEEIRFDNYKSSTEKAISAIRGLSHSIESWVDIVVSSSSFPENLSDFEVSPPERRIKRYELDSWNLILKDKELQNVKYGDYGLKSALFLDVSFAGTISLKYSCNDEYIIYRGVLTGNHELGHRQYIKHCQNLVSNPSYSGRDFSWGDLKYYEISLQDYEDEKSKSGNTTNWVQFSQNHHITLMHSIL
ncbi:beta family protein [Winogradskyella luteola]|uniref:Beta protein n=1 Tax=Winogradskyella luteola TaxID=2828330 RepID=A0A9X1F7B6_9FLAO|nr:beta family protein [Winogradskyella luteola]MBV7268692.1 hypothetical protein [Winogradskyella luteola]